MIASKKKGVAQHSAILWPTPTTFGRPGALLGAFPGALPGAPAQVWCFSAVRMGSEKQKVAIDGLLDMLLLPVTELQV